MNVLTCAHRSCSRPPRVRGVCRVHLAGMLAAGRRTTPCTPTVARLDRLTLARYVTR